MSILGKNTVSRVWEIAEPLAKELGLILWDVRFVKEGANYYLRIFIDKEGGVTIDDCVNMSRALDAPLDEGNFIEQSYNMQVSSPGIERELTREFHFDAFLGSPVILRLIRPFNGVRNFHGELSSYCNGDVSVILDDETEMTAQKKEIAFVKLDDFNI
ncbi:MAG: ribosome maturation factor RimP [Clostridiales bacterium]|nr:ribosome maturation factor RimP [Clostridiales bacterium]